MSGIRLLDSGQDLGSGNLGFPDLQKRLEQDLGSAQTSEDLANLIGSLNSRLRGNYSEQEIQEFKRLRQRAYERKRSVKSADLVPDLAARPRRSADLVARPKQDLGTRPKPRRLQIPDLGFQIPRLPDLEVVQIQERPSQISADVETPEVSHEQIINKPIEEPPMSSQPVLPTQPVLKAVVATHTEPDFLEGMQRALKKIDGERFLQTLPSVALLFGAAVAVGWLVWQQSIALYKSAGFEQPDLIAAGALIMVIGFAAYHAVSHSKLAILLCLYAGGYEAYFMVSGTFQDENVSQILKIQNDPELIFLRDAAEKARSTYQTHNTRYEDQAAKTYHNAWFKKEVVDPAWAANETTQKNYLGKKSALESVATSAGITWLKVFYRLGLVFLCMILAHGFIKTVRKD